LTPRATEPTVLPMLREDFIIRIIRQVIEALARMAGLRTEGDPVAALAAADEAYDLLGVPRDLAAAVDSATLADLLRHPEKIRAMVRLSQEEAAAYHALRDPLTAAARYRRATELMLELRVRDPRPEDAAILQELFRHIQTGTLDPRYKP
jgi:hypothetical protein